MMLHEHQANHTSPHDQTIEHYITYSVITSQPALSYTSVLSTIRCFPVTSGKHEGHTFVQWSGNFSSDADAGMILIHLSSTIEQLEHSGSKSWLDVGTAGQEKG